MPARTVDTSTSFGQIFATKPEADESGCLALFTSSDLQRLLKTAPDGPTALPAYSALQFSSRGDNLASVDQRGTVFVYHLAQNRFSCVRRGGLPGTAMAFGNAAKQNELLVAVQDGTILCYNTASGQLIGTLKGHRNPVRRISLHPSGGYMLSTSTDTTLLWDTRDWTRKRALGGGASGIVQASFTPTGDGVLILFKDDTFMLWDFGSFALRASLARPSHASLPVAKAEFTGFCLDSEGRLLVSGGRGSALLYVWDVEQRALLRTVRLPAPCRAVCEVSFLPDDSTVAALCDDGVLRFVDVVGSRLLFDLGGRDRGAPVTAATVDPRGLYCAAAGPDGALRLYDLAAARAASPLAPVSFSGPSGSDSFPAAAVAAAIRQGAWTAHSKAGDASALHDEATADENATPNTVSRISAPSALRRSAPAASRSRSIDRTAVGGGAAAFELNEDFRSWATAPLRGGGKGKAPAAPAATAGGVPYELLRPGLDRGRLRGQVVAYGEFPAKYRLAVWQFLLGLPRNRDAFAALSARGPHPAFAHLAQRLPIPDRRLLARLQRTLSRVGHWAPVAAELEYLPALAFPFVKLFDDEVLALEATLTVLLNWGGPWLEHFPGAPAHVLDDLDRLLLLHDEPLFTHLRSVGASRNAYGWGLLKTLLTEVLSKRDWLALWDNLLTEKPAFILFAAVAVLKALRAPLLRLSRPEQVEELLSRPQAVDVAQVARAARAMWDRTGAEQMPRAYQPPDFAALPEGPGAYPALARYPKFVADLALAERARIEQDEEDLRRRRFIADSLRRKTADMEAAERAWRDERGALLAAEEERRRRLREEDGERLRERARLDAAAAEARLKQAEIVEEAYRRHVDEQRAFREAEIARLEDEIERRRARAEYETKARLEAEAVAAVELEAWKRVQAMRAERGRALAEEEIRAALETRNRDAELREQLQEERWRREDEERRTRLQLAEEGAQQRDAAEEEARLRREVDARARAEDVKRDIAVTQIERERRVRQMAEEELLRLQTELADKRREDEALRREEDLHLRSIAEADRRATAERDEERQRQLEGERQRAVAERALREERLRELEREQRRREFEADYEEARAKEREGQLDEEFAVQRAVSALDQQRRREHLFEAEAKLRARELEEKHDFARRVREAERRAASEERGKFDALRGKLWEKVAAEEAEMRRQHERLMAKLAVAREKRLTAAEVKAMDRTQRAELRRLARERGERDVERGDHAAAFLDDEMRMRSEVARAAGQHARPRGGGRAGESESGGDLDDSVDAPPTNTTASTAPSAPTDVSTASTDPSGGTPGPRRPRARLEPESPSEASGGTTEGTGRSVSSPSETTASGSCSCSCSLPSCCRRAAGPATPSTASSPSLPSTSPASSDSSAARPCRCDCCSRPRPRPRSGRAAGRAAGAASPAASSESALSTISEEGREAAGEAAARAERELRAARADLSVSSPASSFDAPPAARARAPVSPSLSEASAPDRVYVIRTEGEFRPDAVLGLRDLPAAPAGPPSEGSAASPAGARAAEAELDRIEGDVRRLHGLIARIAASD